jgi:hypothetical protein
MSKTKTKFLNSTQRKVVRKYLSRKQELNQKIPFTTLIKQQLFRGIDIQHLKKLFKNEVWCIQDEERRKQVMTRKQEKDSPILVEAQENQQTMENSLKKQEEADVLRATLRDQEENLNLLRAQQAEADALRETLRKQEENLKLLRAQHEEEVGRIRLQFEEKKCTEQQVDADHFQQLVIEVIQKDKQLKENDLEMERLRLKIQELCSSCEKGLEKQWQTEEENRELEQEFFQAEKDREYFRKCTEEWQVEYKRLEYKITEARHNTGHDQRNRSDYYELYEQMESYRFKLNSVTSATSVEQEIRYTSKILREGKRNQARGRLTMIQMRDQIISEGKELNKQNVITWFDFDTFCHRSTEYWRIRNKMTHEKNFLYEMDHKEFQEHTQWIIRHLQDFQDSLQSLYHSQRQ